VTNDSNIGQKRVELFALPKMRFIDVSGLQNQCWGILKTSAEGFSKPVLRGFQNRC